jgi:hypothetical protein
MTLKHRGVLIEFAPRADGAAYGTSDAMLVSRRRLLAASAMLLALTSVLGASIEARAANPTVPGAVGSLDVAAMALFDAAESANWDGAAQALKNVTSAALGVKDLEPDYIRAGGEIGDFIEAQNNLSGDLVEANLALSVKDKRWLVSAADRIESRAGELSQPFAARSNTVAPRVATLLFLVRRMRRALVWEDDGGFRDARDAFDRLWSSLRIELAGKPSVGAVQGAVTSIGTSPTGAGLKKLYTAVLAMGGAA